MEPPPELAEAWRVYEALAALAGLAAADRFYLAELLPRELAYLKARRAPDRRYAASLHTLGESAEAVVIAAHLLGARQVVLLASPRTESNVPRVAGLLPGVRVAHRRVDPEDLDAVLAAALEAARDLPRPLAVDMTGGTKVMAAAMALAAERLQADLYYLASQHKTRYRRPLPGSERLVLVRNITG